MNKEMWERGFRRRIDLFEKFPEKATGQSISIKIRVTSGCYHRTHSPMAYQIIDDFLESNKEIPCCFEEHESGPELLLFLTIGTDGISLAKSIIDLIKVIIMARSDGIKKGDQPNSSLELVVRGYDKKGTLKEERIMEFRSDFQIDERIIENVLKDSVTKLFSTKRKKSKRKK